MAYNQTMSFDCFLCLHYARADEEHSISLLPRCEVKICRPTDDRWNATISSPCDPLDQMSSKLHKVGPVKRICVFEHSVMTNSEGPGIWPSVWRFLLTHCLYEQVAEVLARLCGCAGSPEPSLLAQAISTKFAWRGPSLDSNCQKVSACS